MDEDSVLVALRDRLIVRLKATSRPGGFEPDMWSELTNWQSMGLSVKGTELEQDVLRFVREEVIALPPLIRSALWWVTPEGREFEDAFTSSYIEQQQTIEFTFERTDEQILQHLDTLVFIEVASSAHPESWDMDTEG